MSMEIYVEGSQNISITTLLIVNQHVIYYASVLIVYRSYLVTLSQHSANLVRTWYCTMHFRVHNICAHVMRLHVAHSQERSNNERLVVNLLVDGSVDQIMIPRPRVP